MRNRDHVYYRDLVNAADYIGRTLRKYGRIYAHDKTKFDDVRVYVTFGICSLHGLIFPGYVYNKFPNWLHKLDIYVLTRLFSVLRLPLIRYQRCHYGKVYARAIEMYPAAIDGIVSGMDHPELCPVLEELVVYCSDADSDET